jgi:hypothetical protein
MILGNRHLTRREISRWHFASSIHLKARNKHGACQSTEEQQAKYFERALIGGAVNFHHDSKENLFFTSGAFL